MARSLVNYAKQLKNDEITKEKYDSLTSQLFPEDFDQELQDKLLVSSIKYYKE